MSIYEPLTGNVYTTDPDYAALSGRVVRAHVQPLGITLDGYVVGRVTRVIDIGRADDVKPVNPDAEMTPERWDTPKREVKQEARDGYELWKQQFAEEQRKLQVRVVADLTDYGWSSALHLAQRLNMDFNKMIRHLNHGENDVYCKRPVNKKQSLWGLVGIHD